MAVPNNISHQSESQLGQSGVRVAVIPGQIRIAAMNATAARPRSGASSTGEKSTANTPMMAVIVFRASAVTASRLRVSSERQSRRGDANQIRNAIRNPLPARVQRFVMPPAVTNSIVR
jgi:hypothetical protein